MSAGQRRAQRVGRYHLLDRVACGGMAEVYRAKVFEHDGSERLIALKRVLEMYSSDANFLRMLVAEYHLSALLHHPNIAEVYELFRVPEGYFIAMEYVDGKDLRAATMRAHERGQRFEPNDAAYLMARALDGLEHAHRACADDGTPLHLVHRDFSPSNVLVGYDGSVKIIDFGIAKAAVPRDQTAAGIIKGKVRYMSPEQANGDPRLTAQSDVFSAGSVLYELLAGRPAFSAPNELEMIYTVRRAQPVPLAELAPEVPPALVDVVQRAMSRSRRQRYGSAAEFRGALVEYLRTHAPGYRRTRLANFMRLLWEREIDQEIATLLEFAITDEPPSAAENLLETLSVDESLEAAGFGPDAGEPLPSGPYPMQQPAPLAARPPARREAPPPRDPPVEQRSTARMKPVKGPAPESPAARPAPERPPARPAKPPSEPPASLDAATAPHRAPPPEPPPPRRTGAQPIVRTAPPASPVAPPTPRVATGVQPRAPLPTPSSNARPELTARPAALPVAAASGRAPEAPRLASPASPPPVPRPAVSPPRPRATPSPGSAAPTASAEPAPRPAPAPLATPTAPPRPRVPLAPVVQGLPTLPGAASTGAADEATLADRPKR